jgi:hypothetical protein
MPTLDGLVSLLLDAAKVIGVAGAVGAVAWGVRRYIDHVLDTRLASQKSALDRQAEQLRHDLQRDMVMAQLSANQLHVVYPRLFDKIQRAHGAIAGLMGARRAPSYEGYTREDVEATLTPMRVPGEDRQRVLTAFDGATGGSRN